MRRAWDYPWSSAAAHCGLAADAAGLLDLRQWAKESAGMDWKAALSRPSDKAVVESLRLGTTRGRPVGSDRFVAKLEKVLGRRLRPLPVGRPKNRGQLPISRRPVEEGGGPGGK